jgi:hypothetical protein
MGRFTPQEAEITRCKKSAAFFSAGFGIVGMTMVKAEMSHPQTVSFLIAKAPS